MIKTKLNLEMCLDFSINDIEECNEVKLDIGEDYAISEKYLILANVKNSKYIKHAQSPEERYGFRIVRKYSNLIEIESNGYNHIIPFSEISRFKGGVKTMTHKSKLKFMNENSFFNTDLRAVNIEYINNRPLIRIENIATNESSSCLSFTNPNIKRLISQTTKNSKYLDRIKLSLGNFYDYSKTKCDNSQSKAIVTCPIHGDFEITVSNTLNRGCGCNGCSLEKRGFNRGKFIDRCKTNGIDGILYLLKCESDSEIFYKIGITSVSIKSRIMKIPYRSTILMEINGDASSIYDLEIVLHRKFASNSYFPKIKFKGRTECFKFDNENEVINLISGYKSSI